MFADINFFGIFVNGGLATASVAILLQAAFRRWLSIAELGRRTGHVGLGDLSIFIILWGCLTFVAAHLPVDLATILG
jgi:hypothetical protein